MINVGKNTYIFYILVNEQNYDKSIDNYIFLEYSLNMLTANVCSI